MNKIICYINNNYIDIKKNNNYFHIILDSINNDDIINSKNFIKNIKNYNLFSDIIINYISIYLNHEIKEKDIIYYKTIFDELNCSNIKIYSTKNKLTSPTLINNNEYYILYYKDKYIKLLPKYLPYFLKINNIKILKIISKTKLKNNSNTKYYYFNNPDNYFLI